MADHKGLPVAGYRTQSQENVDLANEGKVLEEQVLRYIDKLQDKGVSFDQRFIAAGKTDIQKGFMLVIRGIFQPQRIDIPSENDLIHKAAKAAHEANRAICLLNEEDVVYPTWDDCPEEIRQSSIAGVKFLLDNPDATPEDQHKSWVKFKLDNGWVFGEKKDEVRKTHPCLVPYHELPKEQRIKDLAYQRVVRSIVF